MGNPFSRLTSGRGASVAAAVTIAFVAVVLAAIVAAYLLPGTLSIARASAPPASHSRPDSATGVSLSDPDILYAQVTEAQRRRDWAACIEALDRLISVEPEDSMALEQLYQAHVNLAWELTVNHRFDEAREQFTRALRVKRDSEEAQQGLRLLEQLLVSPGGGAPPVTPASPVCTPTPVQTAVPTSPPPAVSQPTPLPPACAPQPAAPAPANCVPSTSCATVCCYTVQTGDTLFALARRFGTTVEAIMAVNQLTTCTIRVCQQLLIPVCAPVVACPTACPPVVCQPVCVQPVCPAPCPTVCVTAPVVVQQPQARSSFARVHVVQRGEDIFRLAIRYNVSVTLIMRVNKLETTTIRAGQALLIP